MHFPEDTLDYEGKAVRVKKLAEIDDGEKGGVALYSERGGSRFFGVFSGVFCNAAHDALQAPKVRTLQLGERQLMEAYVKNWARYESGEIGRLLLEAIGGMDARRSRHSRRRLRVTGRRSSEPSR